MHAVVFTRAAHHTHIVRAVPSGPHAALGVEHVAARQHAHVVLRRARKIGQPIEAAALKHDAPRARETRLAHVGRIIVHHRHVEAHVRGQRRHLARRVRRAQKPHAHRLEQRHGKPRQALELLVVHARAARDVLHLEHVARARLARRHDLLRVVAEEHERLPVGRACVAVLLRHLVVGVALRLVCIVDDLEAQPRQIALADGAQRALECGDVGRREAFRQHVQIRGRHMLVALQGFLREAGEVLRGKRGRAPGLQIGDDRLERFPFHAICTVLSGAMVTRPSATQRNTRGYSACSTAWIAASNSSSDMPSSTRTGSCATMGPLS